MLSDRYAVWWSTTASGNNAIWAYDLVKAAAPRSKISDPTAYSAADPEVSGSHVVWSGMVGTAANYGISQIYYWDGTFLAGGVPTPAVA